MSKEHQVQILTKDLLSESELKALTKLYNFTGKRTSLADIFHIPELIHKITGGVLKLIRLFEPVETKQLGRVLWPEKYGHFNPWTAGKDKPGEWTGALRSITRLYTNGLVDRTIKEGETLWSVSDKGKALLRGETVLG